MENWRVIADFPDYAVSDQGTVKRIVDRGTAKAGRVLKPGRLPGKPYLMVGLVRDGQRTPIVVHRLVMDAFIGPRPDGMERSHLDGDASHNALSNLAYEPHHVNNARKVEHGTAQIGEACPAHKLTSDQVLEIRSRRGRASRVALADEFGVSPSTIRDVLSGKSWKHLTPEDAAQRGEA